jgi:hypothetical protein
MGRFIQPAAILLLSILLCSATQGQLNEPPVNKGTPLKKMYFQAAAGLSTNGGIGYEFSTQAIFKHNWVSTFSWQNFQLDPKNKPADYERGFLLVLIIPIMDPKPVSRMNFFNFSAGKSFEVGRKLWFTTEAGLSIVNGDQLTFTPQVAKFEGMYMCSNYEVKKQKITTLGGVLRADFNWAFSPYVGMGVTGFANLNSQQSPVGAQLKFMFGWMNRKK